MGRRCGGVRGLYWKCAIHSSGTKLTGNRKTGGFDATRTPSPIWDVGCQSGFAAVGPSFLQNDVRTRFSPPVAREPRAGGHIAVAGLGACNAFRAAEQVLLQLPTTMWSDG